MSLKNIIDLTQLLEPGSPTWNSHVSCAYKTVPVKSDKSLIQLTQIQFEESGVGTHIDGPSHFSKGACISDLPIDRFIAPLNLIDLSEKAHAGFLCTSEDIESYEARYGKIPSSSAVYIHFGWCKYWKSPVQYRGTNCSELKFPSVAPEAALLLAERKISLLGVDTLSPDCGSEGKFPVHEILLSEGICIIENLGSPQSITARGYSFCALPLRISHLHESPTRAFAFLSESEDPVRRKASVNTQELSS